MADSHFRKLAIDSFGLEIHDRRTPLLADCLDLSPPTPELRSYLCYTAIFHLKAQAWLLLIPTVLFCSLDFSQIPPARQSSIATAPALSPITVAPVQTIPSRSQSSAFGFGEALAIGRYRTYPWWTNSPTPSLGIQFGRSLKIQEGMWLKRILCDGPVFRSERSVLLCRDFRGRLVVW